MNKQAQFGQKIGNFTFYNPSKSKMNLNQEDTATLEPITSPQKYSSLSSIEFSIPKQKRRTNSQVSIPPLVGEFNLGLKSPESRDFNSPTLDALVTQRTKATIEIPDSKLDTRASINPLTHRRYKTEVQSEIDKVLSNRKTETLQNLAFEFRHLKIKEMEEPIGRAKRKLSENRAITTASHFFGIRPDVSNYLDHKILSPPSRQSELIPEVKNSISRRVSTLAETLSSKDVNTLSPQTILNSHRENLINNSLKQSKFLRMEPDSPPRIRAFKTLSRDIASNNSAHQKQWNDNIIDEKLPRFIQKNMTQFDLSEKGYLHKLRNEIPTVFGQGPASRGEVIVLSKWISETIQGINESNIKIKQKFQHADEVYNICLNELIRQISIDCLERGELVMRIWKAYLDLTYDILDDFKYKEMDILSRVDKEEERLREKYQSIFEDKENTIKDLASSLQDIIKKYQITKKIADEAEGKEIELKSQMEKLDVQIGKWKKQYKFLFQEHRDLEYKYEKLRREKVSDSQISDSIIMENKVKRQGSEQIESISQIEDKVDNVPAFGIIRQKLVQKEDKEVQFENFIEEGEIQTTLCLVDERYDVILKDMEKINQLWREENIKVNLLKEAEMMENMAENEELTHEDRKKLEMIIKVTKKGQVNDSVEDSQETDENNSIVMQNQRGPAGNNNETAGSSDHLTEMEKIPTLEDSDSGDAISDGLPQPKAFKNKKMTKQETIEEVEEEQKSPSPAKHGGAFFGKIQAISEERQQSENSLDKKISNHTSTSNLDSTPIKKRGSKRNLTASPEKPFLNKKGNSFMRKSARNLTAPENKSKNVLETSKHENNEPPNKDGEIKGSGSGKGKDPKTKEVLEAQEQKIIKFMQMYKIERQKLDELSVINQELETRVAKDEVLIFELQNILNSMMSGGQSFQNLDSMEKVAKHLNDRTKHLQRLDTLRPKVVQDTASDDEDDKEEIELSPTTLKSASDIHTPMHRETRKMTKFYLSPISVNRKAIIQEKKAFNASGIIAKLRETFETKLMKMKSVLPAKSVLKQITFLYWERSRMERENLVIKEQDMGTFVYKQFINTFGTQKFSLEKFTKFCVSARKNSNIPRINKFCRLVGLLNEGHNYTMEEAKQYIAGMDFLLNSHVGETYKNPDHEKKYFVPFSRAMEYLRVFGEKKMRIDEMADFKKEIEKLRLKDHTGRNAAGLIDVDEFLDKIIFKYKLLLSKGKDTWMAVFHAADLIGDNQVRFEEFCILFKYMEPEKFDERKVEEMFNLQSDVIEGDHIALSFGRFLGLCFEFEIFSEEKQNKFLEVGTNRDIERKFEEFGKTWEQQKPIWLQKVEEAKKKVPEETIEIWKATIENLDSHMQKNTAPEKRAILIKAKVLKLDIESFN